MVLRNFIYKLIASIPSRLNHGNFCMPPLITYKSSLRELKSCNLIFSMSTGREGSGQLAAIFSASDKFVAHHERRPFVNGAKLISESLHDRHESFVYKLKICRILRDLRTAKSTTYLESSHLFSKTFGQYILKHTDLKFSLVRIRRPISETVTSQSALGWFSYRHSRARNWIYMVNETTTLKRSRLTIASATDESTAYVLNEKLRENEFIRKAGARVVTLIDVRTPLRQEDKNALARIVGVTPHDITEDDTNHRTQKKTKISNASVTNEIKEFINANKSYLETKTIKLLDTNQLHIDGVIYPL